MLELYTVKDNKFSPLLVDDILKKIKTETSYFINSENDTEFKIIQFLAENGTSENEIIIIYEILYNIYRGNTTVKEIANYLKENNLDISYQSLFLFFENNSGDITEDIRQKLSANTAQRNKSRKGKLAKIAVIKDGVIKIIGAKNLDKYLALGYAIHQKGEKDGE